MMDIRWNALKNVQLKMVRGVSFDEIIEADLIDITDHPTKGHQKILIYEHKGYLWAVPYVVEEDGSFFLKTIYPDRRLMKKYKRER